MDFSKLRRYDVQASLSMVLSMVSLLPMICGMVVAFQRYDHVLGRIIYGSQGKFVLILLICLATSMMPAGVGFLLGWSSAGQRRNDKPKHSWMGFFIGGTVVTLNLILLIAFYMLRLEKPM